MATFRELFKGKRSELNKKLLVCNSLLASLLDKDVITYGHVETIQSVQTNTDKITALLGILERADDRRIPDFLSALTASGQPHIIGFLNGSDGHLPPTDKGDNVRQRYQPRPHDTSTSSPVNRPPPPSPPSSSSSTISCYIVSVLFVMSIVSIAAYIGFQQIKSTDEKANAAVGFKVMFEGHRSELIDNIDPNGMWSVLEDRKLLTARQIEDCKGEKTTSDQVSRMLKLLETKKDSLVPEFCKALVQTGNTKVIADYLKEYCRE